VASLEVTAAIDGPSEGGGVDRQASCMAWLGLRVTIAAVTGRVVP